MTEIQDRTELPEPKTPAEFRERAELLMRQAANLPRVGFTLMSMALREGAAEMMAEATRLEEESGSRSDGPVAEERVATPIDEAPGLSSIQQRIVEIFASGATPVSIGTMRERRPPPVVVFEEASDFDRATWDAVMKRMDV